MLDDQPLVRHFLQKDRDTCSTDFHKVADLTCGDFTVGAGNKPQHFTDAHRVHIDLLEKFNGFNAVELGKYSPNFCF